MGGHFLWVGGVCGGVQRHILGGWAFLWVVGGGWRYISVGRWWMDIFYGWVGVGGSKFWVSGNGWAFLWVGGCGWRYTLVGGVDGGK